MLTVSIKIGEGNIIDSTEYGFIYLSSDHRMSAPTKGFDTTSYPEEEGEHILPKTVDDAFDYKVRFFIQATSLKDANECIAEFNNAILPLNTENGIRTANVVEFYNNYKRHKIVGYPQPIDEATDFWRDPDNKVNDIVIIEWTIRVTKPSLCDFNL